MDESIKEFARLDGIVTLVDAKHIEQHLNEEKPEGAENESVEQVAFADRLLLNRSTCCPTRPISRAWRSGCARSTSTPPSSAARTRPSRWIRS